MVTKLARLHHFLSTCMTCSSRYFCGGALGIKCVDLALRLQEIRNRSRLRAGKTLVIGCRPEKALWCPSQPASPQCGFQYVRRHFRQEHPREAFTSPSPGNRRKNTGLVLDHSGLLFRRQQQHAVTFRLERERSEDFSADAKVGVPEMRAFRCLG